MCTTKNDELVREPFLPGDLFDQFTRVGGVKFHAEVKREVLDTCNNNGEKQNIIKNFVLFISLRDSIYYRRTVRFSRADDRSRADGFGVRTRRRRPREINHETS